MEPCLVAIVDDDAGVRGSVRSLLRSAGMEGIGFSTAEELLAYADHARLDCIVTDLHMPGMSGVELQRELARRSWGKPVIVITAFPSESARQVALTEGAHAFLSKPVPPDTLLGMIETAIG